MRHSKVKINDFSLDIQSIDYGIIFLYASWSQSRNQLRVLVDSLSDFRNIEIFLFDVDMPESTLFFQKNGLFSNGWGETYWIKNGRVLSFLDKYANDNLYALEQNNERLLN